VKDFAAQYGRAIDVYAGSHIVCRRTRAEAEEYYRYYADEKADRRSIEYLVQQKQRTSSKDIAAAGGRPETNPEFGSRRHGKLYPGVFPGYCVIVGSPDDVAEELAQMSAAGLSGTSISFLNYLDSMPLFVDEVLPRLERLGLRQPVA
jgi:alkanesulfonate monooxygenase SsuD/methylene tetrahydromethanopterin reductase-like flavin-dependent oxidoreductase (luciferase family)